MSYALEISFINPCLITKVNRSTVQTSNTSTQNKSHLLPSTSNIFVQNLSVIFPIYFIRKEKRKGS